MIYTFNQYYLTTRLTHDAARDVYLSYTMREPEHKLLLKIYDAECCHPDIEPEDFQYFARKFKSLSHPHIVPLLDIGIGEGQPYVVREYFPGGSLRQQLERGASEHFLLDTALALILDVGDALSYAHSQNLVHQKVKPENVFLNAQGEALLADFSLHELINEIVIETRPDDRVISYMAPEQLTGSASPSSDQYALACLFYELITGKLPFTARDLLYLWQSNTLPSPIPPSQFVATLPKPIESAVLKALSKKPKDRYADVAAFLAALQEAVRPAPPAFPFEHLIPGTDHQSAVRMPKEPPPPAQSAVQLPKETLPPATRPASAQAAAHKEPESDPLSPAFSVAEPGQSPEQGSVEAPSPSLSEQSATSQREADTDEAAQQANYDEQPVSSPGPVQEDDPFQPPASPLDWLKWLNDMAIPSAPSNEEAVEFSPFPFEKKEAELVSNEEEVELSPLFLAEEEIEPAQLPSGKEEAVQSSLLSAEEEVDLSQQPFAEEKIELAQLPLGKEEKVERSQLSSQEEEEGLSSFSFMKSFSQRLDAIQKVASESRSSLDQQDQGVYHGVSMSSPASTPTAQPASVPDPISSPVSTPAPVPVSLYTPGNIGTGQSSSSAESSPVPASPVSSAQTQRLPVVQYFPLGKRSYALLSVALICIVVIAFFSTSNKSVIHLQPSVSATPVPVQPTSTVVTITPAKKELQHTYTILAVTSTPDSARQQITARQLTAVIVPQSQTVQATGISTTPATPARGVLTLYNYSTSSPLTLRAGMEIANMQSTSVDMLLDAAVTAPPAQDLSNPGTANVPAHVVQVGTIGNLPPVNNGNAGFYFCTNCPNGNVKGYEIENDTAFSGGQNAQTVTTVQQSDIDNAAKALEAANSPNFQQIFQTQIRTNDRLLNSAQCRPNVSSNPAAGEQATSVTVAVTFTCTGEVYGQSAALALAQKLLMNQAKDQFGPYYTLQGSIAATVTRAVLTDAARGTITLTANTTGTWLAQFDNTYLQALAASLAGKTKQEAQAILSANKNIANANIQTPAINGDSLPTDAHQITIVTNP